MNPLRIRRATPEDIDILVGIENGAFGTERISRRSFRALIDRPTAEILMAEDQTRRPLGYAMLLFRKGTRVARLYSIAATSQAAGKGVARHLLEAAENAALERSRFVVRLEVREDNGRAIALYRHAGYHCFGRHTDYYEDGAPAMRFEKALLERKSGPCSTG